MMYKTFNIYRIAIMPILLLTTCLIFGQRSGNVKTRLENTLSGACLEYRWTTGTTIVWSTHYSQIHYCPLGKALLYGKTIKEYGATESTDFSTFQKAGTWRIIEEQDFYYVLHQWQNSFAKVPLYFNNYGQLRTSNNVVLNYIGPASCY